MASRNRNGPDGVNRQRVNARIGPYSRSTYTRVRNRKTGQIRQVSKNGTFNSEKEKALVPEAFQFNSVGRFYDISKGQGKDFVRELNRFVSHLGKQGGSIAYEALRPTFQISQLYVPVESGALKESGDLAMVERFGITVAEITYAKNGRPFYANYVHEISEYSHLSPTRAKFLEIAVRQDMENIRERVIKGAKMAMGVENAGKSRAV